MNRKNFFQITCILAVIFTFLIAIVVTTSHKDTIELVGNPSTGYTWLIEDFDSDIFDVREDVTYLGAVGVTGADSIYLYQFKGLKKGEGKITLVYKRPWMEEISKTRKYKVKVNGKLKIRVSEIKE